MQKERKGNECCGDTCSSGKYLLGGKSLKVEHKEGLTDTTSMESAFLQMTNKPVSCICNHCLGK